MASETARPPVETHTITKNLFFGMDFPLQDGHGFAMSGSHLLLMRDIPIGKSFK